MVRGVGVDHGGVLLRGGGDLLHRGGDLGHAWTAVAAAAASSVLGVLGHAAHASAPSPRWWRPSPRRLAAMLGGVRGHRARAPGRCAPTAVGHLRHALAHALRVGGEPGDALGHLLDGGGDLLDGGGVGLAARGQVRRRVALISVGGREQLLARGGQLLRVGAHALHRARHLLERGRGRVRGARPARAASLRTPATEAATSCSAPRRRLRLLLHARAAVSLTVRCERASACTDGAVSSTLAATRLDRGAHLLARGGLLVAAGRQPRSPACSMRLRAAPARLPQRARAAPSAQRCARPPAPSRCRCRCLSRHARCSSPMTFGKSISITSRGPTWATAFTKPCACSATSGGRRLELRRRRASAPRARCPPAAPPCASPSCHHHHARVQRRLDRRQPEARAHVDHRHDPAAHLHQAGDVGRRARHRVAPVKDSICSTSAAGSTYSAPATLNTTCSTLMTTRSRRARRAAPRRAERRQIQHQRGRPSPRSVAPATPCTRTSGSSSGRTTISCWPSMRSTAKATGSPRWRTTSALRRPGRAPAGRELVAAAAAAPPRRGARQSRAPTAAIDRPARRCAGGPRTTRSRSTSTISSTVATGTAKRCAAALEDEGVDDGDVSGTRRVKVVPWPARVASVSSPPSCVHDDALDDVHAHAAAAGGRDLRAASRARGGRAARAAPSSRRGHGTPGARAPPPRRRCRARRR